MRILMISKACVIGSYQRKLELIAAHDDVDLTVIVPKTWKDARGVLALERAHTEGYHLIDTPIAFNGDFHLHFYPHLNKHIKAFQPDIVHIDEEPYNLATFHALWLARRHGAKALFFSWQNIYKRYPPPFRWMERWVLKHSDYGLVGNQEALEVWRRKGYDGPLDLIPQFGVDPAIFHPEGMHPPDDVFTIGFAGRLVEEKGLHHLIKAALGLTAGRWQIRLAGGGPYADDLATLAGILNIGGQVQFDGSIPSTQMPDWYRQQDVIVLPSLTRDNWKEQFGRLLVEAMACGVPVVGSDSGAIPDVIGDAGLVVPEGDEEALRTALHALMDNPHVYQQAAEAGRRRVLEYFTQQQIADGTVDVYRQMY